jgi:hypothetical protein
MFYKTGPRSHDDEGTCWLKAGVATKEDASVAENTDCGFASTPIDALKERGLRWFKSSNGVWSTGCDFVGGDFKSDDQVESDGCLGKCFTTKGAFPLATATK